MAASRHELLSTYLARGRGRPYQVRRAYNAKKKRSRRMPTN
jgi:hypothetical protein